MGLADSGIMPPMKCWEIIADKLSVAGWSWAIPARSPERAGVGLSAPREQDRPGGVAICRQKLPPKPRTEMVELIRLCPVVASAICHLNCRGACVSCTNATRSLPIDLPT